MFDPYFSVAIAADQVVVVRLGDFVNEMPVAPVRRAHQTDLRQEFKRAIDGGFCQAGQTSFGSVKYFNRGKVHSRMMKHVQDRKPLGCHAIPAGAQLG